MKRGRKAGRKAGNIDMRSGDKGMKSELLQREEIQRGIVVVTKHSERQICPSVMMYIILEQISQCGN
jgi:hypothetical protein